LLRGDEGELPQGKEKGELAERESLLAGGRRRVESRFVREELGYSYGGREWLG
jgi:hypothetical protein